MICFTSVYYNPYHCRVCGYLDCIEPGGEKNDPSDDSLETREYQEVRKESQIRDRYT